MRRSTWNAVLITVLVLAIAGIVPWMLRGRAPAPAATGARAATLPGAPHAPLAATNGLAAPSRPGAPRGDDRELLAYAVRGGLIAAGAGLLVLGAFWALGARGGARRRAITLAGRGLRTADVARRTRMSQDAVRTLLVPHVAARRPK